MKHPFGRLNRFTSLGNFDEIQTGGKLVRFQLKGSSQKVVVLKDDLTSEISDC